MDHNLSSSSFSKFCFNFEVQASSHDDVEMTLLCELENFPASMNHRPNALIVDIFGTQILSIAEEFNIPKYVFHTSIAWQNYKSILFVSFGSGGALSSKQMIELAWSLELSQQKVVWVVRPSSDGNADSAYLNSNGNHTHGTLTNWVPMIAWPLHAEQKMNAAMLMEELGVAIRPAVLPTKKLVKREDIQVMVRILMDTKDGKSIREKARKLKISAENVLSEGGSSYNSMCEIVKDIRTR
ncbi:hypothetical protein RDI58_004387 [Solanum bulbocastanum]|uniref:Uncharacterized protein n=1 Tax=Solanum bulbocastanum TaxID=147425 RepID=A0AAN8U5R1_SOLBU